MSGIEAVYIADEHNNVILSHTFTSRPPPASQLLPLYLSSAGRPSVLYLPNTNPSTLLFSIVQDRLLFLAPSSTDTEPLLVLEFLHRVADALEEFLGAPLLASRIVNSYDVVAQVLGEMCDGGLVGSTEANALRDVVETSTWVGKLVGGLGLPGSSPAMNPATGALGQLGRPSITPVLSTAGSAIPWRRANVRHTSNELYVDIVETLAVTYAPSGRPLAAFANGSIAFTCKVSGVPDLLLVLTTGSGGGGGRGDRVHRAMERPVFHPCVRLARWREHGELSFVPPDGRFVLAGYEVDLLDASSASPLSAEARDLNLPASLDVRTGLGAAGNEFEVRLSVNHRFAGSGGLAGGGGSAGGAATQSLSNHLSARPASARTASGDAKQPLIQELLVSVPIPSGVKNLSEIRASKGEAHWSPGETAVEWRIGAKEAALIGSGGAVLRCTAVGPVDDDDEVGLGMGSSGSNGLKTYTYDYEEDSSGAYQSGAVGAPEMPSNVAAKQDAKKGRQNSTLMPDSATVSFSVKGWLASGLKVDSLTIDTRKSKGLGDGVRPYKGVKYLTVSRGGVEVRC